MIVTSSSFTNPYDWDLIWLAKHFNNMDIEDLRKRAASGKIDFSSRCIPTLVKCTQNYITDKSDYSHSDYLTPVEFAQKKNGSNLQR